MNALAVHYPRRVPSSRRSLVLIIAAFLVGSRCLLSVQAQTTAAAPTSYVLSQDEFNASVDRLILQHCDLTKTKPTDTVASFEGSLPTQFQLPSDSTQLTPLLRTIQSEALRAQAFARMGFTTIDSLAAALGAGTMSSTTTDLTAANGSAPAAPSPAIAGIAAPATPASLGTSATQPNPTPPAAAVPAKKLSDSLTPIQAAQNLLVGAYPPLSQKPNAFDSSVSSLRDDMGAVIPSASSEDLAKQLTKVSSDLSAVKAVLDAAFPASTSNPPPSAVTAAEASVAATKTDVDAAVAKPGQALAQTAVTASASTLMTLKGLFGGTAPTGISDAIADLSAAQTTATSLPATGTLFSDTRQNLIKAKKDLAAAKNDQPAVAAAAAADVTVALSAVNTASGLTSVNHLFLWTGYQVANPYVFTPSGSAPSATTAPGAPSGTYNGTIAPSTTYGFVIELDYLNRLAWDPTRRATYSDHTLTDHSKFLSLLDFSNWDFEARMFSSLNAASAPSGTASGTTPTTTATAIEGSGDFGAEVAAVQNLVVTNDDLYNFQTLGIEERAGMVSNRAGYRNHQEFFIGPNYTIGYWPNVSTNAEPVRLNVRYGFDYLDSVTFVDASSQYSTAVLTNNGTANQSLKLFTSLQAELIYPLTSSTYLVFGGRIYSGHNRPTPWTSYLGYSIDVNALAQGLGLAPKPAPATPPASPPNTQ